MHNYLIVVVAVAAALSVKADMHECGKNEMWSECPTDCQPTCKCLHEPMKPCTMECQKPACICQEGFARNDKNECVPKHECCGKNMEWSHCSLSCPLTCDNFWKPHECAWKCDKLQCVCKHGHFINDKKECVHYRECCGPNKMFSFCPKKCPLTCANHKNPPTCTMDCREPSCICKPGLVMNDKNECVPISSC